MQAAHTLSRRTALALLVLGTGLGATSCQNMHSLVTGEAFYKAPKELVRVEVEVQVQYNNNAFSSFKEIDDPARLRASIAQRVLALGDLGMRFYPILSEDYAEGDARPPHLMVIRVQGFDVNAEHDVVEVEGSTEPQITTTLESVDCDLKATIQRRRADAPPLVIGTEEGHGRVRIDPEGEGRRYAVANEETEERLEVRRREILDATEKALINALRGLVEPVDRELLHSGS